MNTNLRIGFTGFCLLLLLGHAQAADLPGPIWPAGKDLGVNGAMESAFQGMPQGWIVFAPSPKAIAEYGDFGISGSKGMRLSCSGGGPEDQCGMNQAIADPKPGMEVEITAWVRIEAFKGALFVWARCDGPEGPENRPGSFENSAVAGYDLQGTKAWSPVTVRVTPSDRTKLLMFGILAQGQGIVHVDEFRARVREKASGSPAGPSGPGIFLAEGRYNCRVAVAGKSLKLLVPMPVLWRGQIPLTFRIWTDPPGRVESAVLKSRPHGHFCAEVVLLGGEAGQTFRLSWDAYVLALPHSPSAIPPDAALPFREIPEEAKAWMGPSWCCDYDCKELVDLAASIRQKAGNSAAKVVEETLAAMKKVFAAAADGFGPSLRASEALKRKGSCTSCANLGAALLRAQGIPARIIAGYPTWSGPLQTHYVVEYWIPGAGWRVMETTLCMDDRPPWEQIQVAVVLREDEANEKARLRPGVAAGVPFLSLTEYPDQKMLDVMPIMLTPALHSNSAFDHRAVHVAALEAGAEAWASAAIALETRWRKMTGLAMAGSLDLATGAMHRDLSAVKTLDALLEAMK